MLKSTNRLPNLWVTLAVAVLGVSACSHAGNAPPKAGTGTVANILAQGGKDYAAYIANQIGQLNDAVKALDAAMQAGNVEGAKTAYAKARPFYERAESSVEGFVLPGFTVGDNAGN